MKIEDLEILSLFQGQDWQNETAENMPDCFLADRDSLKNQDIVINLKNTRDNVYLSICFRYKFSRVDFLFAEHHHSNNDDDMLYIWNAENDKACSGQDRLKQQYKNYFPFDFFDKYLEED